MGVLDGVATEINRLKRRVRRLELVESASEFVEGSISPSGMSLIESIRTDTASGSVVFSDISQSYKHLVLYSHAKTTNATERQESFWQANDDTGSNYDTLSLRFSGDGASSNSVSRATTSAILGRIPGATACDNAYAEIETVWQNYSSSGIWKASHSAPTVIFGNLGNDTDVQLSIAGGQWRSGSAVSSMELFPSSGNWAASCVFDLYGVI